MYGPICVVSLMFAVEKLFCCCHSRLFLLVSFGSWVKIKGKGLLRLRFQIMAAESIFVEFLVLQEIAATIVVGGFKHLHITFKIVVVNCF